MPARLSEVFRAHPVHLHDTNIEFESVRELPDSHAWPLVIDYPSEDMYDIEAVPIIDLMDPNATNLVGNACERWGVFQVTNHGIPIGLLEDVESEGRRLFQLPAQQKLKAARPPNGISGYGRARINAFFPKLMWSEGFTIVGSPVEDARQLWPQEYNTFWKRIKERSLKNESEGASAALQLNSYPPCPEPKRAMGLAAHTDSTLLTVLYQNSTSGLQVLKDGVRWVSVPPRSGTLVVNVGDLLHILSNGRFLSVLHRAVVHRTRHRLSLAYLYGPPSNIQIAPLSKLIDQKHPPLYHPVTWSEYLGRKAKHFNKALSTVRLCGPQNVFIDMNDQNRMKVEW
ncbi:hypothetical protein AQUCO_00100646v1 [Aquilegia coerulea]|uniref:Fe2OG dioxygenase domain-containing protein n=1 Tax=Aquilegia coerulea TaxID=218851 RepID=A0A2G5FBK2_AQUCA|nr:hypothetical protein AQUCO_00100646v1 [Aquilegia coerulea]